VRGKDNALNFSPILSSFTFVYDNEAPISRSTFPVDGSVMSDVGAIAGPLRIRRGLSFQYGGRFDRRALRRHHPLFRAGTGFVACDGIFNPTAMAGYNWTYSNVLLTYEAGRRYVIRSQAADQAGNVENQLAVNQRSFLFDNYKPTASVTSLLNGDYVAALSLTVSGNASDTAFAQPVSSRRALPVSACF